MTLNTPKVSIALCTYNGSKYISQQLESIINQSYQNLEIIIIDDQSKDNTVDICKSYIDKRIKVLVNDENLGYTKNFERAISLCSSEYICLCDQDDIWKLNKIEILLAEIENNILIYHDSDFIDQKGEKLRVPTMAERYNMYDGESALPFLIFNCISGHAVMFKKELIKNLYPFDERFFHDWWLVYVAVNTGTIKFLNRVLVSYRQHEESITDNLGIKGQKTKKSKRVPIDISWLEKCKSFTQNKDPKIIDSALIVLKNILGGKKKILSFFFLLKNYDLLFYIANKKRKNLFSKINSVRKIIFSDLA